MVLAFGAGAAFGLLWFLEEWKGFPRRGYAVRERDITYRAGWLFRSTTTVPFGMIQHSELSQGPVSRKLGLNHLKLFTAGGSGNLRIAGLEDEDAQTLRAVHRSTNAEMSTSFEVPKRQHPLGVLIIGAQFTWKSVQASWPILIGASFGELQWYHLMVIPAGLVLVGAFALLYYLRFSFLHFLGCIDCGARHFSTRASPNPF